MFTCSPNSYGWEEVVESRGFLSRLFFLDACLAIAAVQSWKMRARRALKGQEVYALQFTVKEVEAQKG